MSRLETASRQLIEARQLARLQFGMARILPQNLFYHEKLFRDKASIQINQMKDFKALPFTTRSELFRDQQVHPPFGYNMTYTLSEYLHLHRIQYIRDVFFKVLDTRESWSWWADCWVTVYRAVGVTRSDIIFFAYDTDSIALWTAFEGAKRLGALTSPVNGLTIHQVLKLIEEYKATVLVCTPEFVVQLREVVCGSDLARSMASVRMTLQSMPIDPATQVDCNIEWEAISYEYAGLPEVGLYGFPCLQKEGIHVNEGEFVAEILDPESLEEVAEGQTGELVLTNLGRWGTPALRYRTGYLFNHDGYNCRCGRSYLHLSGGIQGRVPEQST